MSQQQNFSLLPQLQNKDTEDHLIHLMVQTNLGHEQITSQEIFAVSQPQEMQIQSQQLQSQINAAVNQSLNQYTEYVYVKKNGLLKSYRKMLKKMKIGYTRQNCTICLNKFEKNEVINQLPCQHIFHKNCCKNWFKVNERCPVCRYHVGVHFLNIDIETIKNKDQKLIQKSDFQKQKQSSENEFQDSS